MSPRGRGNGRGMGFGNGGGRGHRLRDGSCRGGRTGSSGTRALDENTVRAVSAVALPVMKLFSKALLEASQRLLLRAKQASTANRRKLAAASTRRQLEARRERQQVEVIDVEALPVEERDNSRSRLAEPEDSRTDRSLPDHEEKP